MDFQHSDSIRSNPEKIAVLAGRLLLIAIFGMRAMLNLLMATLFDPCPACGITYLPFRSPGARCLCADTKTTREPGGALPMLTRPHVSPNTVHSGFK